MKPENYRGFSKEFADEFIAPQIKFWLDNVFKMPAAVNTTEEEYYKGMENYAKLLYKKFAPPYYNPFPSSFPFHDIALNEEEIEALKGIIGDNYSYLKKNIEDKKRLNVPFLKTEKEDKIIEQMNTYLNHVAPSLLDSLSKKFFVPLSNIQEKNDEIDFDVFICHASEDKEYANKLATSLNEAGVKVWYDEFILNWGMGLRSSIDRGLANTRYGIVIFSKAFLEKKKWTEHELNGMFSKEGKNGGFILPIWHNISQDELIKYSPAFADRLAKQSDRDSIEQITKDFKDLLSKN